MDRTGIYNHDLARPKRQTDRNAAIKWARELLARPNWVLLDTETTGIDDQAEIIQLGVTDNTGQPIIDNMLIKPLKQYIPTAATNVHHITWEMVDKSPSFLQVWPLLDSILRNNHVVIFNAAYDTRLITQTARLYRIPVPPYSSSCAMLNYAQYLGDWNEYRQSYKWPKLKGGDHSAVGDCKATLEVVRRMANSDLVEAVRLI